MSYVSLTVHLAEMDRKNKDIAELLEILESHNIKVSKTVLNRLKNMDLIVRETNKTERVNPRKRLNAEYVYNFLKENCPDEHVELNKKDIRFNGEKVKTSSLSGTTVRHWVISNLTPGNIVILFGENEDLIVRCEDKDLSSKGNLCIQYNSVKHTEFRKRSILNK